MSKSLLALRSLAETQTNKPKRKIVRAEDIVVAVVAFIESNVAQLDQFNVALWGNNDYVSTRAKTVRNAIDDAKIENILVGSTEELGIFLLNLDHPDFAEDEDEPEDDA
jgi:hypothetical protein